MSKPAYLTPAVIEAAKPVWGAFDKVIAAMNGKPVEPDAYDNLNADRAFAADLATDRWCPPTMRKRLVRYIEKIDAVLRHTEDR